MNYKINYYIFNFSGFKTPLGVFAVGSLHILPLWMYGYESRLLSDSLAISHWIQLSGIAVLSVGRTVCAAVEVGLNTLFQGWVRYFK